MSRSDRIEKELRLCRDEYARALETANVVAGTAATYPERMNAKVKAGQIAGRICQIDWALKPEARALEND